MNANMRDVVPFEDADAESAMAADTKSMTHREKRGQKEISSRLGLKRVKNKADTEPTGQTETEEHEGADAEEIKQQEPRKVETESEPQTELVCRHRVHAAAAAFPPLQSAERQALAEDIKANGLRQPVVLHPDDDSVLDGVNRLIACDMACVKPHFTYWQGKPGEEWAYVISQNLRRRHLSGSQLGIIAAKIATLRDGQRQVGNVADVPTQAEAADMLGISERTVRTSRKVLENTPRNIIALVEQQELSVNAAAAVADATPDQKKTIATMRAPEAKALAKRMAKEKRSKTTARARGAGVPVAPETNSRLAPNNDYHENHTIGAEAVARALEKWRADEGRKAPLAELDEIDANTPERQAFVNAIGRLPPKDAAWACQVASYVKQEACSRKPPDTWNSAATATAPSV